MPSLYTQMTRYPCHIAISGLSTDMSWCWQIFNRLVALDYKLICSSYSTFSTLSSNHPFLRFTLPLLSCSLYPADASWVQAKLKLSSWYSFGKHVSNVGISVCFSQLNHTLWYFQSDKVKLDINMLGLFMVNLVLTQTYSTLAVTMNCDLFLFKSQFCHHPYEPDSFFDCLCSCCVFCLSCWQSINTLQWSLPVYGVAIKHKQKTC